LERKGEIPMTKQDYDTFMTVLYNKTSELVMAFRKSYLKEFVQYVDVEDKSYKVSIKELSKKQKRKLEEEDYI
jgi:hypothetical protein